MLLSTRCVDQPCGSDCLRFWCHRYTGRRMSLLRGATGEVSKHWYICQNCSCDLCGTGRFSRCKKTHCNSVPCSLTRVEKTINVALALCSGVGILNHDWYRDVDVQRSDAILPLRESPLDFLGTEWNPGFSTSGSAEGKLRLAAVTFGAS